LSSEIQRETSAINSNLQRKVDELRKIEREHEINLSKLRDLTNMLDSLRAQEIHSGTEKRRMEDELEDLTRERNELIRRMNELSDRYEDYVQTMNRERLEIMKANKNHVKLLTAKLLFQIFQDIVLKRKKAVLQEVKGCSQHIQKMERKMLKFTKVMSTYYTDRKTHYLRKWYRQSMNFVHENYKKLNLVEFQVNKKRKIQFFFKWRQAFL
jgi:chromosome segregation ATPase